MVKIGTKRSNAEIFKIVTLAQTGIECSNQGYVYDLQYYQGEDSIFKAQQIASKMPQEDGDKLISAIRDSNIRMETESTWGGVREGSGRPSTGRKKHIYYITDGEAAEIKNLIEQLRKPSK